MVRLSDLTKRAYPYYADGSHGWNHIRAVYSRAEMIAGRELSPVETAAILFHDCSLSTGPRETHETDSAKIAETVLTRFFGPDELNLICNAIRRHRASYTGTRETYIDRLLSAADRDPPEDAIEIFRRSYLYGLETGHSQEWSVDNAYEHVRRKYGVNGYAFANAPDLYLSAYGADLERLQKEVEATVKDELRKELLCSES